jgi:hypothetical protein
VTVDGKNNHCDIFWLSLIFSNLKIEHISN